MIFKRGDVVKVAKKLPSGMDHFNKDFEAIVQYSYGEAYGNGNSREDDDYSLMYKSKKSGEYTTVAWYPEITLTLVRKADGRSFLILGKHGDNSNV